MRHMDAICNLGGAAPERADTSVGRHGLIDLRGPFEDSALQISYLLEALLAQERDRLGAAHPTLAMDHDFAIRIEFAEALGQLRQRHDRAAGDPADGDLRLIAHIEDENLL